MDGKEQDFFNEQDKLHMADVQGLFIRGLRLRTWAAAVLLICLVVLIAAKASWKYLIPRAFQIALGLTAGGISALLGVFVFEGFFSCLHKIS